MKPQPKAKAKPAVKAKPVAKAAKAVKTAKPVAKKPVAKAPAKKAVKAPAKKAPAKKPAAKVPAKAAKSVAKAPVPKAKPAAKAPPAKPAQASASKTAPATAVRPAPAPVPVKAPPPRTTKQSARYAPPPAPPAVAAATAKASYTPMMPNLLKPAPHVAPKKDPKLANNWKAKSAEQLSDAEVIAMPDTEYMNDKQLAFFRLKLQALKEDILNSAGETTEHLREDTVIMPDPADRATIEEEHALELRTRDRERKLLKKIEQSIGRIDAGDYGYCDETGEPIGVARLLARPTATLSLEAQERRELKQKMFGD